MPAETDQTTFYVTTPIYYVNDRPHIGHCYTTLVADLAARAHRLLGRDVFFLTGTDEHAEKVSAKAAEHGIAPMAWATQNAERFREAFAFMRFSNDDFVRTTEDRHTTRASAYIQRLVDSGDIELGDYVGWYDPSQEEYVTESVAKEHGYQSPVTGRDLEQRTEQNYFFDLPAHEGWLREQIETGALRILPEARRNEVLSRIRQGLQRVPVSRRIKPGDADWGIRMPGDPDHRIYVWIEALCNYLTVVDTDDRRRFWPADVHFMAKDILWFHAVIWPCMLHALGEPPPRTIYAHAYYIAEGRKMSKSLGNFIEIDLLRAYGDRYGLDALRWFLATQGPLGATDADFAYARFVDIYNAELANGIGNAASRVGNMIAKYYDGAAPAPAEDAPAAEPEPGYDWPALAAEHADAFAAACREHRYDDALALGVALVTKVDGYINATEPFRLAKKIGDDPAAAARLAAILRNCAEALRIASLFLSPAMPHKTAELWRNWSCDHLEDPDDFDSGFRAPLAELARWNGDFAIKHGQPIQKGDPLFMRANADDPPPAVG